MKYPLLPFHHILVFVSVIAPILAFVTFVIPIVQVIPITIHFIRISYYLIIYLLIVSANLIVNYYVMRYLHYINEIAKGEDNNAENNPKDKKKPEITRNADVLGPAYVGIFESIMYPIVLIFHWEKFIAVWLVLKTAASWNRWQCDRRKYNKFLIGNAISLSFGFLGYLLLKNFGF